MRKFNWVLNALTLVAMALALVVVPVSADPEGPTVVLGSAELYIDPPNAKAGAHYVLIYQLKSDFVAGQTLWTWWPDADTTWLPGASQQPTDSVSFDGPPWVPFDDDFAVNLMGEGGVPGGLYSSTPVAYVQVSAADPQPIGPGKAGLWDDDDPDTSFTKVFTPTDLGGGNFAEFEDIQQILTANESGAFLDERQVTFQPPAEFEFGAGRWIRIDIWGPPSVNIGHENAGLVNPADEGTVCVLVGSDEEYGFGNIGAPDQMGPEWACGSIEPPLAVRLWRKYQVPLAHCGYNRFEYIGGFETIEEAVYAADEVWLNHGDYANEAAWNMFEDCPDFRDVCDPADPKATGNDCAFVENAEALGGVAVGAVIEVDPGVYTNTDTAATWSIGYLDMDTPGLIVGSTDGPLSTTIVGFDALHNVIDITAGGVTLGESEFDVPGAGPSNPLKGFTVEGGKDGVYVKPTSDKCSTTPVYSSTVEGWGILTGTNIVTRNITFLPGAYPAGNESIVNAIDNAGSKAVKLVNLSTGWSGHINTSTTGRATKWVSPTATLDITVTERFTDGDYVAVFYATGTYTCPDARIDVRGNHIHANADDGIDVYSASVWVDSNEVYDNDDDGFVGTGLKCCGSIKICDGINRTDKMLEISDNHFYTNGDPTGDAGWTGDDGCFDPWGGGDDSGIQIVSTDPGVVECKEEHLYIHDNLIEDNVHAGIWLDQYAADCGIRILWNEILDNGVFGLSNMADEAGRDTLDFTEAVTGTKEVDVIFKYNDVYGNDSWGVKNWAAHKEFGYGTEVTFNAKENYWGMDGAMVEPSGGPSTGPEACNHELDQRSEAQGYGDAVSKGTFYNPWLSVHADALRDLPYQHIRAYGSDSLQLQAGWNTLAVPLPLETEADDLEEICDLGTFMMVDTDPKWEVAYQYDNVNKVWDPIDGTPQDELLAVHGYLIKMKEATRFPVIYDNVIAANLPAYDLKAGWNLIGSAFGIDRVYTNTVADQGRWAVADPDDWDLQTAKREDEAYMKVEDALDSIIDWTYGYNGASMIVDPPMPGQIDKGWPAPAVTIQNAADADLEMATGEAYWVYMKTDGALGGFEIAPLFFTGNPPMPPK